MKRKLTITSICIVLATLAVNSVYIHNVIKKYNELDVSAAGVPFLGCVLTVLIVIAEVGVFVGIYKRGDNKSKGRSTALPWALIAVSLLCLMTAAPTLFAFHPIYLIWILYDPTFMRPHWLWRLLAFEPQAAVVSAFAAVVLIIINLIKRRSVE